MALCDAELNCARRVGMPLLLPSEIEGRGFNVLSQLPMLQAMSICLLSRIIRVALIEWE
jgi:hypothetical protein